jgi:type IV pilus assembly protein PilA
MARAGLILGYMGVAFIPFMLIIAALAIPNLLRSRLAANESSAVGSLRTYTTALVTYADSCPKVGYPDSVAKLGAGSGDCDHANLMTGALANPNAVRYGYRFVHTPGDSDSQGVITQYTIEAEPLKPGTSGCRYFFTDQTGVIRSSKGWKADADSPAILSDTSC